MIGGVVLKGIEESIKKLKKVQENLKNVEGTRNYTMKELFNDDFMSQHTKYSNISDFLEASGFDFSSQEAFRNVDESRLDKYISENSDFSSWEEMKSVAGKIIIEKQIMDI